MRVAIATLGCKVNQYDSAVIERLVSREGWRRVGFDEQADAYVINTCTVTDRADADARRMARRARRLNPGARVVMTGCYAQTSPEVVAALGYVDYVVGLGRLEPLLEAVRGELPERVSVGDLRRVREVATLGIESFPGRTRAFVKVQEGCDLFCTFCIIPVARGRSRSVPPRAVVDELERLAARGYREAVLTGIHLGGYGSDLEPACDLAWLLGAVLERRLPLRVRLSSVDPPEITESLVEIIANNRLFCRHFHVPLQACHDGVLERMRRRYTRDEAAAALALIRRILPDACLGTDLIAGFPGETDEEFEEGLAFLETLDLDYLHVFPYSTRSSTSAAKRWPELPRAEVHRRARRLRSVDARLRERFLGRSEGERAEALFESSRDGASGLLKGYTDNYVPVVCDGSDSLMGKAALVELGRRRGNRLLARLL